MTIHLAFRSVFGACEGQGRSALILWRSRLFNPHELAGVIRKFPFSYFYWIKWVFVNPFSTNVERRTPNVF
jgi:hypothetical protein